MNDSSYISNNHPQTTKLIISKMAKGINTYAIAMAGNRVCSKCDKHGNVFVKNSYADRWSKRTNYNSKGEAGWYCRCKKCGGTKNLGKSVKTNVCL